MKNLKIKTILLASTIIGLGFATSAFATEGYFLNGVGAKSRGLAGADIAKADDAMGASINPAGIVGIGNQLSVGVTLFNPVRGFEGKSETGYPSFTPNGKVESGQEYFPVPAFGYVRQIDDKSAFALTVFGNGGMNTSYDAKLARTVYTSPTTSMPCEGVFCAGKAGVSLNQLYVTATYARKISPNVTVGISPMYALQAFKSYGLSMFKSVSVNPAKMTDNEFDYSHGLGIKLGVQANITPTLTFGAAYQPKIDMSEFEEYAGLFSDNGDFDIPSSYTLGLSYKATPKTTVVFAYRHIAYEDVNAVGNATTVPKYFGMNGGPGFGWDDVDTFKLGVEYAYSDTLTLRGGIASNNNPIGSEDVTLNILAPGVQTLHLSGGATLALDGGNSVDFAITYSPEEKVKGIEVTPMGANPYHTNELNMHQLELTAAFVHKF